MPLHIRRPLWGARLLRAPCGLLALLSVVKVVSRSCLQRLFGGVVSKSCWRKRATSPRPKPPANPQPRLGANFWPPQESLKTLRFFKVFGQDLPDGLQNPQVGAKMAHEPPKLEPRWPTDLPTWSQDGPKTPTWSQDAPKTLNFKDFGANLQPPDPQKTLKKQ